jgi:adenylate cyclase
MASKAGVTRWKGAAITIAIGIAVVVAMSKVHKRSKILNSADLKVSDVRIYYKSSARPTGVVVIAQIDDKSIAELGRWPWPRDVEARLESALTDYKVAVVGFDVFFSERDSADVQREAIAQRLERQGVSQRTIQTTLGTSNDLAFANAIKGQGSTYLDYAFDSHYFLQQAKVDRSAYRSTFLSPPPLAYNIVRKQAGAEPVTMRANAYLAPIPELNAAARGVAYADTEYDEDDVLREYPAVTRFNGRYCVPLYLALVDAYARHAVLSLDLSIYGVSGIGIRNVNVPVDERGKMMVHFRGKPGTMPHYSVTDIINHRVPPAALAGKIVLVGVTGHGLGDRFVTPVGADFPGVEVQANAVDNVLAGDFIWHPDRTEVEERYAAWILGVTISVVAAFMSATASLAIVVMLAFGYMSFATRELNASGTLVGVVYPFATLAFTYLALVSYRYITEGLEKRHLRHVFEHYLDPDVIASVLDDPGGLKLGGERRHLSILFSDIVGFTARAERSEPEPLVAMLNTYMTAMTNVILESGGVVDKLMGDGIMAFWGAPLHVENPARDALNCALKMFDELHALAERDERFGDINIGIGITTGEAVVGNFGGERRFDYSVIGDTVNLASRLESLTRQFKVRILVNRQTLDEAGDGYIAREIGLVKVKGKDQLVPVVDVAGRDGDGVDPAFYQRFAQALGLLHEGRSPASDLEQLLREHPNDQVIAMCLERLKAADGHPPPEMVFEFDTK